MSGLSGGHPKGRGYSPATGVKMTGITKKKQTAEQARAASATASSGSDEDKPLLSELLNILSDLESGDYTAKGWGTPKREPPKGSLNKVEKCLQSLRQHIKRLYMESMQKGNAVQAVRNHLIDIKECVDQDDYENDTSAKAEAKGSNMKSKNKQKKDEDEMTKREILKTLSTFSKTYKSLKRLNDEVVKWKQSVCGPRVNPNQKQTGQTKSVGSKVPVPETSKEESGEEALDLLRKENVISMTRLREQIKTAKDKVTDVHLGMLNLENQCRGSKPTDRLEHFDEQKCIAFLQGVIEEQKRLKQLEEHIFQWEHSFDPIEDSESNDAKKDNKLPSNRKNMKHGKQTAVPTTPVDRSGEEVIQSIKAEVEKEMQKLKQLEEHIFNWERSFPPIEDSQPNDPKKYNNKPSIGQRREHGHQTPVPSTPLDRSGEKVIQSLKATVEDEMQKLRVKFETAEKRVIQLRGDMMYIEGLCIGQHTIEGPEHYDKHRCIDSVFGLIDERDRIRDRLQQLEKEMSTQTEHIEALVMKCEGQSENVQGTHNRDWKMQINILLKVIEDRSRFIQENTFLEKRRNILERELEMTNKEIERLEKENSSMQADFEKDKKHLMLRLSKMAGAKLTDNNPNIADLSDPDRAVKLAERFSEIYDNQWTEAFECLDKHNWKDIDVVLFLYSSLLDAYKFCVNVSDNQMAVLKSNLVCPVSASIETKGTSKGQPDLSTLHRKALSDLRKENKESSTQDVKRRYVEKRKADGVNGLEFPIVETYITECVDVCWRMTLLSPRVYIETEDMEKQKVVKEKYKLYTKNGSKIDYVVWPALYLHKDGPLLQKGVVQPK